MRYLGLLFLCAACEDLHIVTVPNELTARDAGPRSLECGGADPEEPDESCPGSDLGELREDQRQDFVARLYPAGDVDLFRLTLRQIDAACTTGATQHFCAEVKLFGSAGQQLSTTCDSMTATGASATGLCFAWSGSCGVADDRVVVLEVSGPAACQEYDLQVQYYAEGTLCPC
jgi:hypothetical protein